METHYPRARVEYIMQVADCKFEFNDEAFAEAIKEEPAKEHVRSDLHAPAFAVFTSGSTGKPKGILHQYGNWSYIMESVVLPEFNTQESYAFIAPLNFVAFVSTFACALKREKTCLHILPYDIVKSQKKMAAYLIDKKITQIFASPSLLRANNNFIGFPLKFIVTGSEAAIDIYNPNVPIYNFYSMSETGFCVAQFLIDKPYKNCPIGKPVSQAYKVFLVREDGTIVTKTEEEGEICVENPYVAGYIGMPEETAKAFVKGVYHTHDLGKYDENGNIVYIGRIDDMIKINGNRVEPGEIERVAKEVMGVNWCAVRGFTSATSYICLYYKDDIKMNEDEIRKKMEEKLPYYMIPAYFMRIDEIPLTPTGKFYRKGLPQPIVESNFSEYVAPTNEIEKLLCDTFSKVLNVKRVGINDDFYLIGGDSLKSMEVVAAIDSDFFTADTLFKGRTPKNIAKLFYENEKKNQGISWMDTEIANRKECFDLLGVEKKYVEEMLREKGKLGANLSRLISFPLTFDAVKLADAINKMIKNRPIWGTVYYYDENGDLKQRYDETKLPHVEVEKMTDLEFDRIKGSLLPVFEPIESNMAVARVIQTESKIYALIGMSHAKIDGFGEKLFWTDIFNAYQGKKLSLDSYYSCLADKKRQMETEEFVESKKYFDDTYGTTEWLRALVCDGNGGNLERTFHFNSLPFDVAKVEEAEKRLGASRNVIFATITLIALARVSQNSKVMLNWTYQDRSDKLKKNAGGLMMKRLPVALDLTKITNVKTALENTKEQMINGMSHSIYEWICENENGLTNDVMSFVYQPSSIMEMSAINSIGATVISGVLPNPGTARKFAVMVLETKNGLRSVVNYMKGYYSENAIKQFHETFSRVANDIITNETSIELTAADFLRCKI